MSWKETGVLAMALHAAEAKRTHALPEKREKKTPAREQKEKNSKARPMSRAKAAKTRASNYGYCVTQ
jgi:hypothetical protein